MPYLRSNGINIYYEIHGKGEPLLLIQGTFDSAAWALQVPALSQKYEVIIFDNRGTGRTDAPQPPYSIEDMTNDALGLLESLGIDRAHLLGYSIGGYVALEMGIRRPELVNGLILCATSNGMSSLGRYRTRIWTEMFKDDATTERILRDFLPWVFSERFFDNEENSEAFIRSALTSQHPQTIQGLTGLAGAITGYRGTTKLAEIKSPALIISGSEDLAAPAWLGKRIADGIHGARMAVLEGAAHMMIIEDSERLNNIVLDFLEGLR